MSIQENGEEGDLKMEKVNGDWNPADALTKGLGDEKPQRFLKVSGQDNRTGRAESSLQLKASEKKSAE